MWLGRVWKPGPLALESDVLPSVVIDFEAKVALHLRCHQQLQILK